MCIMAVAGEVQITSGIFKNIRSFMNHGPGLQFRTQSLMTIDSFFFFVFSFFFAALHIINMFSLLIRVLYFLCFVSRQESVSNHTLPCDFSSSRCTQFVQKVCSVFVFSFTLQSSAVFLQWKY